MTILRTVFLVAALWCWVTGMTPSRSALLIAHRGASAYAPEHTAAAYLKAIAQGADYVEQDLQFTRDGALVVLHDAELSRTTNAAEVFPEKASVRDPGMTGTPQPGWYAVDFTLAELKRLDAGRWFNRANPHAARPEYEGLRVLTLEEAIETVAGRAGLYIETKQVDFYAQMGFDMAQKLAGVLGAHRAKLAPQRPVYIQSFYRSSLERMKELDPAHRRIQLLPAEDGATDTRRITPAMAREIATYAHGVGPNRTMISGHADVAVLHDAGLEVHPYTFRGPTTAVIRAPLGSTDVRGIPLRARIVQEIRQHLEFGIDGGFTDYPDLWREAAASPGGSRGR